MADTQDAAPQVAQANPEGDNALEQFTSPVVTNDNATSPPPPVQEQQAATASIAPPQKQLPTLNDFLGQKDQSQLPSMNYFLKGPSAQKSGFTAFINPIASNQEMTEAAKVWSQKQPLWNIVSAFGKGFAETMEHEAPLDKETEDWLKNTGAIKGYLQAQDTANNSVMSAYVVPYAKDMYESWRRVAAATAGTGLQIGQSLLTFPTAIVRGLNEVDPALGALPEMTMAMEGFGAFHTADIYMPRISSLPPEVAAAKSSGALENEGVFTGVKEPTPAASKDMHEAAQMYPQAYDAYYNEKPKPEVPQTVHDVARQVDPVTFTQYDELQKRQASYRQWISDFSDRRKTEAEANAPNAKEIADLEDKIKNEPVNARQAGRRQDALDRLKQERDDSISEAVKIDSPDMARVRRALQQNDFAMRDLAPKIGAAYREAEGRMPPPPAEEAVPAVTKPEVAEAIPAAEAPKEALEQKPVQPPTSIRDKVSKDLTDLGRPKEEADAAGEILNAHYQTRSERFKGKLGTAEEMYDRDAPNIRQAYNRKNRGKISLATQMAKATIALFRDADASTFFHETGHHWLDELLQDAQHPDAPQDLKDDATAVRKWLNVGDDVSMREKTPTGSLKFRKEHEKFARGFERYLMEGTAPTRALEGVFTKLKDWLTQIYQTVQKLRSPINDDIRDVFDRLLTNTPEKAVIAPEVPEVKPEPTPQLPLEQPKAELPTDHPNAPYTPDVLKFRTQKQMPFKNPILKWIADRGGVVIGSDLDARLREMGIKPGEKGVPVGLFKESKSGGKEGQKGQAAAIDGIPASEFNDHFGSHLTPDERGYADASDIAAAIRDESFGKKLGDDHETAQAEEEAQRMADLKNDVFEHATKQMGVEGLTNADVAEIAKEHFSGADITDAVLNHLERTGKLTDELSMEKRVREAKEIADSLDHKGIEVDNERSSRTFQEAEDEYRSAQNAGPVVAGEGKPYEPGLDAGDEEGSAENIQQGVGGTGASGLPGQGQSAGRPNPDAAAKYNADRERSDGRNSSALPSRPDSDFVDKAGNIRLENLSSEEDVRETMRILARDNNDFMDARRGVVPDSEIDRLVADMGVRAKDLNLQKLRQMSLEDGIPMAVRIKAGRMMLKENAKEAVNAMAKFGASGLPEDLMAMEEVRSRHFTIANTIAAVTAEWGRAGRAFRDISEQEKLTGEAVTDLFQSMTGKTPSQMRRMAKMGGGLSDAQQVNKFLNDSIKPSFGNMILEYFTNGLISGPATHTTYSIGNELLSMWKAVPETAVASIIGKAHEVLGHETSGIRLGEVGTKLKARIDSLPTALSGAGKALKTGVPTLLPGEGITNTAPALFPAGGADLAARIGNEQKTWNELGSDLFGTIKGLRDSFIATGQIIKNGGIEGAPVFEKVYSPLGSIPDIAIKGVQIPFGSVVRSPSRLIAAIHSFFRISTFSMEKAADAYRTATNEGLAGTEFAARVADMNVNPTNEAMNKYTAEANETALMAQGGQLTKAISRFTNSSVNLPLLGETKLLKFIDPFVNISSNIMSESLVKRTPLGILSADLRADIMGKNGAVARDTAQARMLVGTALAVTLGGLASEGLVSGSGPSDPRQNAAWRMLGGNQPHSVRIGDIWYDTHRLGPLGMIVGVGADMHEVADQMAKGDASVVAATLMHAITQNVLDESWMRGPSELIRALTDSERYGDQYVRNFVSSFVPMSVGMSQMARASDPYSRQARSVMDAIKLKIPGLSQDLYPRRDVWGEPIANKDVLGAEGFSAIYEQKVNHDPVNQALLRIGVFPSQPQRKIRGVELNDQQYDDFSRISGRLAKQRLDGIVAEQGFTSVPSGQQIQVVKKIMEASRETARKIIMMKNPEIMQQAVAKKVKAAGR